MQKVTSSNIRSIGFDNDVMHVEFASGRVYAYTGPKVKEHYEALMTVPSVGTYFAKHVKNCPDTKCRPL